MCLLYFKHVHKISVVEYFEIDSCVLLWFASSEWFLVCVIWLSWILSVCCVCQLFFVYFKVVVVYSS